MLFLLGAKQNLQTLRALTAPYTQADQVPAAEMRLGYQSLLDAVQPAVPHANSAAPAYVTDPTRVLQLLDVFRVESSLDDTQYDMRPPESLS